MAVQSATVRPWADRGTGVIGQENSLSVHPLNESCWPLSFPIFPTPKCPYGLLARFRADDYRPILESSATDIRNQLF